MQFRILPGYHQATILARAQQQNPQLIQINGQPKRDLPLNEQLKVLADLQRRENLNTTAQSALKMTTNSTSVSSRIPTQSLGGVTAVTAVIPDNRHMQPLGSRNCPLIHHGGQPMVQN